MTEYTSEFFQALQSGSQKSAAKIVPLVLEIINAKSIIDIGCGTGGFLSVGIKHGLNVLGVDGDYVNSELVEIDKEFLDYKDISKPFYVGKTFDLVVSLEVAEHLFAQDADQFIDNLISHGNVILFSAAIPMQGGTHHVNEQWPQYWSEKFKAKGYACFDYFRPKIWNDPDIEWWYTQNLLLYVKETELSTLPTVVLNSQVTEPMPLVHPRSYIEKMSLAQKQLEEARTLAQQSAQQPIMGSDLEQVAGKDLIKAVVKRFVKRASILRNVWPTN